MHKKTLIIRRRYFDEKLSAEAPFNERYETHIESGYIITRLLSLLGKIHFEA